MYRGGPCKDQTNEACIRCKRYYIYLNWYTVNIFKLKCSKYMYIMIHIYYMTLYYIILHYIILYYTYTCEGILPIPSQKNAKGAGPVLSPKLLHQFWPVALQCLPHWMALSRLVDRRVRHLHDKQLYMSHVWHVFFLKVGHWRMQDE